METGQVSYFLFPGSTVPERNLRNFFIFLPGLSILEITRPASFPNWCRDRFTGLPVIRDSQFLAQTKSCIQGYRAAAEVHGGGGGTLGYLAHLMDEAETRLKIQEQLRGKCPTEPDAAQIEILRSAVFLEIARELDEREFELESGYARVGALEKEFRQILGIEDEDLQEVPASNEPPLAAEGSAPSYMLAARVENWFRLFSTQPLNSWPVFVASPVEAVEESLDSTRRHLDLTGDSRKEFPVSSFSLGSFPRMDRLGEKQFRSFIEAPGTPGLLASYQEALGRFIMEAAGSENPNELEPKCKSLGAMLEKFCRKCNLSESDQVTLSLILPQNIRLADIFGGLAGTRGGPVPPTGPEMQSRPAVFLRLE